jgi:hypothetical protein
VVFSEALMSLCLTSCPLVQVSDLINCGVYVFSSSVFDHISSLSTFKRDAGKLQQPAFSETTQEAPCTCSIGSIMNGTKAGSHNHLMELGALCHAG